MNPDSPFKLTSQFEPKGDQPQAIKELMAGLEKNEVQQLLKYFHWVGTGEHGKQPVGSEP